MRKLVLPIMLLFIAACATVPPMSAAQRRALQTRTFDSEYENVFRSFKTILQDEGYVIKNQDMGGGLIVATVEKSEDHPAFKFSFGAPTSTAPQNEKTGEGYEVSINLEKINKDATESRMTIQKMESFSMGGKKGAEVLDEQAYKGFFDKVRVEIE